jgi:hypothetical protein
MPGAMPCFGFCTFVLLTLCLLRWSSFYNEILFFIPDHLTSAFSGNHFIALILIIHAALENGR